MVKGLSNEFIGHRQFTLQPQALAAVGATHYPAIMPRVASVASRGGRDG